MCFKIKNNSEKEMIHIKQNDFRCLPEIRDIGCFFRSCGLIAEYKTYKYLTVKQINDSWLWAKENKYIDEENCVVKSAPIANHFLEILGDKGRFIEVGTFKNGITEFYPAYKGTELARIDALIQKIKTNGPEGTHFRPVDKKGICIEDPHEPPIKACAFIYSILYAYINRAYPPPYFSYGDISDEI